MNKDIDFYWLYFVKNSDEEQKSARNLIQA